MTGPIGSGHYASFVAGYAILRTCAHSWSRAHVQGVGYGIVVGFGAFFSILTTVMVRFRAIVSAASLHAADVLFAAA